jgi:hypothetical protein
MCDYPELANRDQTHWAKALKEGGTSRSPERQASPVNLDHFRNHFVAYVDSLGSRVTITLIVPRQNNVHFARHRLAAPSAQTGYKSPAPMALRDNSTSNHTLFLVPSYRREAYPSPIVLPHSNSLQI